jgi:hypothetical protein
LDDQSPPRFVRAAERFAAAHADDPRLVEVDGKRMPWSTHYHRRLSYWVEALVPHASEALRLAAHCQHIRRWTIARDQYPVGRVGYKRWRTVLARFHAEQAGAILRDLGYTEETVQRVGDLLLKRGLGQDEEVQHFEDAICLVFLENEFAAFARKHDDEKLISILRKTWSKMSPSAQDAARPLAQTLPAPLRALVDAALA